MAKPATSCHLRYLYIPPEEITDKWTLENTVRVRNTADCTYFCVVGWGPGGYSGIQQIHHNRRVVIFSMWDDGANKVEAEQHGDKVVVTPFGGEGTGMKSMKDIDWRDNENVELRISGEKQGSSSTWKCSCWYRLAGENDWNFVATYNRDGSPPLNHSGFYSFIEDWERHEYSKGHCLRRSADFSGPTLITKNGDKILFKEAMFTKQRHGSDMFAMEKAFGAVNKCQLCFSLSTGGKSETDIPAVMKSEGYDCCVGEHLSRLTFE